MASGNGDRRWTVLDSQVNGMILRSSSSWFRVGDGTGARGWSVFDDGEIRSWHEINPMRAFYSTQKHLRVFILGTPEGWRVSVYDLHTDEWVDKGGHVEATLKTAKVTGQQKVSSLLGISVPQMKWH